MSTGKGVLSVIGSDIKKVFSWITSSKGAAVIGVVETTVETIDPALTGLVNLANAGLEEIFKLEALAAGAAQQAATGPLKLVGVVSALTPEILAYAAANKFPVPDAAAIQTAVNGLVAFSNALAAKA